jgi:hypothetical protein
VDSIRTLRNCWLGFWHGVTRPSLTSLVVAFSLSALLFVALCFSITPDFLKRSKYRYLMENPFDRRLPVTNKIFYSRRLKPPDIVILGDSLIVRCMAGEERLADMVAAKLARPAPLVYDLSLDGESLWEMVALVDQLPPRFNGVLVLGVGPGIISVPLEDYANAIYKPGLGFTSEALDNEARSRGVKVPYRTGIYFVDNWRFFAARRYHIARNLLIMGPQPDGDPLDVSWMKLDKRQELLRIDLEELKQYVHDYDPNSQTNLAIIGRIVAKLKERGNASFILLEAPINPLWYDQHNAKEFVERYQNDLRRFAIEHGMSYLSLTKEAALIPDDLADYKGHIATHEARERCTQAIASKVAKIMTKKEVSLQLSESTNTSQQ